MYALSLASAYTAVGALVTTTMENIIRHGFVHFNSNIMGSTFQFFIQKLDEYVSIINTRGFYYKNENTHNYLEIGVYPK